MKKSIFIKNVKQIKTVGELKKILEKYPEDTRLVAKTSNAIIDLYIGTTHPVGDRETEEETLLIFGGSDN